MQIHAHGEPATVGHYLTVSTIIISSLLALFLLFPREISAATWLYNFNQNGILDETGSMGESSSPYFWLNSGGQVSFSRGTGKTVQGDLLSGLWKTLYAAANPLDTDNGIHPQNLFRLVTKPKWQNAEVSVQFKINQTILSETPNRDGYSGVLLMTRYVDGQNLYYAGIRHDGDLVIKKKINGTYYTLAQKDFWTKPYAKYTNPNNIPEGKWMGMKVKAENVTGGVKITLYLDKEGDGTYMAHLITTDTGVGGPAHTASAHAGLRSDYMDLEFDNFRVVTP